MHLPAPGARRAVLAAFALALALAPTAARAQLRELRLTVDNDAFDFWVPAAIRPDHDYTSGVDLSASVAGGRVWSRIAAPKAAACTGAAPASGDCVRTTLSFGQKLFTPRIDDTSAVEGQRPYAGWLYATATGDLVSARRQRSLEVELGVTGPPSLGRQVQTAWHHLAGFWNPEGWDHQLHFEPAVRVSYGEQRMLAELSAGGGRVATLAPEWGAELGNLRTGAHLGASVRAGYRVPHPWSEAANARQGPLSVYLLGSVRQTAVARDLFLDGNTFRSSQRVERRPFVFERQAGAGVRWRTVTVEYRALTRGRAYRTEPGGHTWSTFELTWRPPARTPAAAKPAARPDARGARRKQRTAPGVTGRVKPRCRPDPYQREG